MKREDGFYWVLEGDHWEVMEYNKDIGPFGGWWGCGSDSYQTDESFREINEARLAPPA